MKRNTRSTAKKEKQTITNVEKDKSNNETNDNTRYVGNDITTATNKSKQPQSATIVKDHYLLPLSMRLLRTLGGNCTCCNIRNTSSNEDSNTGIEQLRRHHYDYSMSNALNEYKQEQELVHEMNQLYPRQKEPIISDSLFCSFINEENREFEGEEFQNRNNSHTKNTQNEDTMTMIENSSNNVIKNSSSNIAIPTIVQRNQQQYIIEHIIYEYHMICTNVYCCNIDIGIIATIRYTISTLRITNSNCNDAHVMALCEILYKYGNGPLSYITHYDLSRLRRNRNYSNHNMNVFQQDTSPFYIVSSPAIQSAIGGRWGSNGSTATMKSANTGFGSYGAIAIAKWIQRSLYMKELYLDRNPIGPYGALVIFQACSMNRTLQKLSIRRCHIKEDGAIHFVQYILITKQQQLLSQLNQRSIINDDTTPTTTNESNENYCCRLQMVDLSANRIGYRGSMAIEIAMNEYHKSYSLLQQQLFTGASNLSPTMTKMDAILIIDMEGNLALQEVMNSITHGMGIVLAFIGTFIMMNRVLFQPHNAHHPISIRHIRSCAIYSISLIVLYTSSTLYHSFFTLRHTKWVFEVIDKCAIYILIAGSYTPFLQIVLAHHIIYSYGLLCFLWSLCIVGVIVEFIYPTWKYKGRFSLLMFLCMGWSALICLPEVARVIPSRAIHLMTMGGISYTAGVPFFIRNNNLDHAVWHLFVLAGSIFHWCGVYLYVIPLPIQVQF